MLKYPILIFFLFISTLIIQYRWNHMNIEYPPIYIPPPKYIHHFHFGYNESMSDSLWLRWVQDVEVCGAKKIARESVLPQKKLPRQIAGKDNQLREDLLLPQRSQICDRGWSFRLLDAITRLTPHFRMPYAIGASTLSVLIDDHRGAQAIYERAEKYFPNDWKILYRAAYHYLYELQDLEKASQLLYRAGQTGAPLWVKSLASRVATRVGRIDLGITSLEDYFLSYPNTSKSSPFYIKVKSRLENLYSLKGLSKEQMESRFKALSM